MNAGNTRVIIHMIIPYVMLHRMKLISNPQIKYAAIYIVSIECLTTS